MFTFAYFDDKLPYINNFGRTFNSKAKKHEHEFRALSIINSAGGFNAECLIIKSRILHVELCFYNYLKFFTCHSAEQLISGLSETFIAKLKR
jgi:hypothetical protein